MLLTTTFHASNHYVTSQ